jgi:hypothetical protein
MVVARSVLDPLAVAVLDLAALGRLKRCDASLGFGPVYS